MNKQRGQISIVIIFLLFLIGGLYVLSKVKTNQVNPSSEICVSAADPTRFITHRDDKTGKESKYFLIRELSALSTEQFEWHMFPHDPEHQQSDFMVNVNGEIRRAFRPTTNCEAKSIVNNDHYRINCENDQKDNIDRPAGTSFGEEAKSGDPKALDLLFVDVTDKVSISQRAPGYIYTEIYLKENADGSLPQIPAFIQSFCDTSQPVDAIRVFGKPENAVPPFKVDVNNINFITNPNSGQQGAINLLKLYNTYSLFAYEKKDSPAGRTHTGNDLSGINDDKRLGELRVTKPGGGVKIYDVGAASYAVYLVLVDKEDPTYVYLYTKRNFVPTPTLPPASRNTLQMGTLDSSIVYPWGWWSPECKPAIYLYPKEKTNVNVKIEPKGYLTYTDPLYPVNTGWQVIAYPDGKILVNQKDYTYLYYESAIRDSEINVPQKGFVVEYEKLSNFYKDILPRLGFLDTESKDFINYWQNILPKFPYYFVGLLEDQDIEKIEPLTISPKPTTIIRVRFYFKGLDKKIEVEEPVVKTFKRTGFTVVEWGGLVKTDKNHPFTCSQ